LEVNSNGLKEHNLKDKTWPEFVFSHLMDENNERFSVVHPAKLQLSKPPFSTKSYPHETAETKAIESIMHAATVTCLTEASIFLTVIRDGRSE
jgi:hypothetical protein